MGRFTYLCQGLFWDVICSPAAPMFVLLGNRSFPALQTTVAISPVFLLGCELFSEWTTVLLLVLYSDAATTYFPDNKVPVLLCKFNETRIFVVTVLPTLTLDEASFTIEKLGVWRLLPLRLRLFLLLSTLYHYIHLSFSAFEFQSVLGDSTGYNDMGS